MRLLNDSRSIALSTKALIGFVLLASVALFVAPASAAASGTSQRIVLVSRLTSAGTTLQNLPGGITYGWNDLRGGTTWAGQPATIRFLGSVNYIDGSGPFGGLVTVTREDGAVLAFSVDGSALDASLPGGGDETTFGGAIRIIGGDGAFRGARGIGTMTGFRDGPVGSPVQMTFNLRVVRPN
jgi:hypothetical protein